MVQSEVPTNEPRILTPTQQSPPNDWASTDSEIGRHVAGLTRRCLDAYRANPLLVTEHANIERATAQGGYGRRQIYELVQNGADALIGHTRGRIHVLLTESALYCANEGEPITPEGVDSILSSYISDKRGSEIGRFGLGFKSVLGVTTCPEFFSRTGSFSFNAKDADAQIQAIVPDVERYPVLRIARSLDPRAAAAVDPILSEMMRWAATVVRVPRDLPLSEWLSDDIVDFPAVFLLFSPHVGQLVLEDWARGNRREIRLSKTGNQITLEEDDAPSVWQVFGTDYIPSDAARNDAGELADRSSLPIMWAVPLQGKAATARGQFWAFFPTEYLTTLSGIVNAPWKTNEDRQNLLTGVFNRELIEAAARLIAGALPHLGADDDPGKFLDLMPARGREAPNWADALLTEKVYASAACEAVVPDQDGVRRKITELHLHPSGMPREALESWAEYPGRPRNWCHHSVDTRERRSRIERLYSLVGRWPASIRAWLEALVADRTAEASLAAILTASAILKDPNATTTQRTAVAESQILFTKGETVVRAKPGTVFVASDVDTSLPGIPIVHDILSRSEAGRAALEVLGIGEVEASSELQALLTSGPLINLTSDRWQGFWELVNRVPYEAARDLLTTYLETYPLNPPMVRTVSGKFRPIHKTLLPGEIVPADGSRDADVAVDTLYHEPVLGLLRALGAVESPKPGGAKSVERWYHAYRRAAMTEFYKELRTRGYGYGRPHERLMVFNRSSSTGPIDPIYDLSQEGKARFTERLLLAAAEEPQWTLFHETRRDHYPKISIDPPSLWVIRYQGALQTSLGVRAVAEAVGPWLREWKRFLPIADVTEQVAESLGLLHWDFQLSSECWKAAFSLAESVDDELLVGRFYAMAAPAREVTCPAKIRCRLGAGYALCPPYSIAVTHEADEVKALIKLSIPFLQTDTAHKADALIKHWQLQPASAMISFSIYAAPSGPEMPLPDRFFGLGRHLTEEHRSLTLMPCSAVRVETKTARGKVGEDRSVVRGGDAVYFIDNLGNAELLDAITGQLGITLSPGERTNILQQRELDEVRQRMVQVRTCPTLAEKLLAAVGQEAIRRHLPLALVSAAEEHYGELSDRRAAELALAGYGVAALYEFREELRHAFPHTPTQWAGSHRARQFVQELGFPKEFAGFRGSRRDAVLEVDGPPRLPPLHPFQESIVKYTRDLLEGRTEVKRALLSLPTGAGKTRVAVESLIRSIADGHLVGAVLWIAQTDELCEQAVQTWSEIWRGLGPRRRLHINRLWASNEADSYEDSVQVVVATDAKLTQAVVDNEAYDWLTEPACVVVDEAHKATQPSYTRMLEWLGFYWHGIRRGTDPCPLIGLTATPFRGDEEQTKRLVARFGVQRLDHGVFGEDPYAYLQDMEVLARVEHRLLKGSTPELSAKEIEDLQQLHTLPASVVERIGADASRNKVLLDSIMGHPSDWPVLLFAASVDHAYAMAALLSAEGIPSAAISSATDAGARRHYVEQFRRGELRVLANYAVLTAGFDAPSVRALYVARPTYSPGLYQQMIGRGLRGPLNGGKERCLIVNVEDNVEKWGDTLAFREFEYLWSPE